MGLFDFLKNKPNKNAILSQVNKTKEIYAQNEYRRMAMEKLLSWGDDDSLRGVLERFAVVVQSPHWDEDEKKWLKEEFIKLGDKVLPLLKEWILAKNDINYVISIYRSIINNDEEYQKLLIEALTIRLPGDHQSVRGKQELIAALAEFKDPSLVSILLPYLDDHSDDVQAMVIDAMAEFASEEISEKFINMISDDSYCPRILRKVADIVSKQKIALKDNKLAETLLEDFHVKSGYLQRLS